MRELLYRDEREAGLDQAADRLAYVIVSFGLLVIVAWRAFALGQASWDLLALVVVGGAVSAAYRAWHRALTRDAVLLVALAVVLAVTVAIATALLVRL